MACPDRSHGGAHLLPYSSISPYAYPSRLPRERHPAGPDGRPATRWTDPRIAAAYAERDDASDRAAVWPALADSVRPTDPRREPGRADGTVLELGCGIGGFARHLVERDWVRVLAVDRSAAMHRIGELRHRDAWIERSLPRRDGSLVLPPDECSGAVCSLLLVHLPHPCVVVGVLSEARRVLQTGAPLAVAEPAGLIGWRCNDPDVPFGGTYVARYPLCDGSHLPVTAWRHSPAAVADCLASSGFALDEIVPLTSPGRAEAGELMLYRAHAV